MSGDKPEFVYTPMHGVGLKIFEQVIQSMGFQASMYPVPQQVTHVATVTDTRRYPIRTFQRSNSLIQKKKASPLLKFTNSRCIGIISPIQLISGRGYCISE